MKQIIQAQEIHKSFLVGKQEIQVLKGITLDIEESDFIIIFGQSGCGKSTLLHTILGLEIPTKGKLTFLGQSLYDGYTEDSRSEFRKRHIGMVYQQPNWIKSLNVIENVAFPLLLLGQDKSKSFDRASELLKSLEMSDWANYRPTELSGGQQQRVSLARALIANPETIIADEPTGNLDYESGQYLMQLLSDLNKKTNKTIIMVTHDLEYLKFAKTAVRIFDGKITEVYKGNNKSKLLEQIKGKRGGNIESNNTKK